MNRDETFDDLCVILEQRLGEDIDTVVTEIMAYLALTSEELLKQLDPPPGLRRWLASHGLVLVIATDPTPGRVLDLVEDEDDVVEAEILVTQERAGGERPFLGVGDYVQYRTAATGPNSMSQLGSGKIVTVAHDTVEVEFSPGGGRIVLFPEADFIQVIRSGLSPDESDDGR